VVAVALFGPMTEFSVYCPVSKNTLYGVCVCVCVYIYIYIYIYIYTYIHIYMEKFFWCMTSELSDLNWSLHFTLAVALLGYIYEDVFVTCMCKSMSAKYSCPVFEANSLRNYTCYIKNCTNLLVHVPYECESKLESCMTVLFLVDKTLCFYAPCGYYGDLPIYNTIGVFIFQK
jgi:hypothetical protein